MAKQTVPEESLLSKLSATVSNAASNAPTKEQATEVGKQLAAEATKFIQQNPWAAVLSAAAIGYFLGASRGSGNRR